MYIARCSGDPECGITAANANPTTTTTTTTTTTATTTTACDHHRCDHDRRPAGGTSAQLALGKQIFLVKAGCGSCHTLKDAGSTGTVGPNLDQLKPPRDIVEHQVENGGGPMPAFKDTLTKDEIDAVSTYVSSVAGK